MKAKEIYMYVLGAIITIGFFATLIVMISTNENGINGTTISLMVGALIAAFAAVYGYFYGSSKGSADKNETIKRLTNNDITNG
jgi:hypothetical protein